MVPVLFIAEQNKAFEQGKRFSHYHDTLHLSKRPLLQTAKVTGLLSSIVLAILRGMSVAHHILCEHVSNKP